MSNDERIGDFDDLVSIGDLVKAKVARHEMHIRTLEAYISGDYPGPATTL